MSFLYRRALLLAKNEPVFRTDSVPFEGNRSFLFVDGDVTPGTDVIVEASHGFLTGDGPVRLTSTGVLPAGLALATDYYIITVTSGSLKLASSVANAVAGTAVDITAAAGGGNHTLTLMNTDAFLVMDPQFTANLTILDRTNVKPHLSPDPGIVARKIAQITFQHEVRNNGTIDASRAPRLGVLLRACGMSQTRYGQAGSTPSTIIDSAPIGVKSPTGVFTFTKTTGFAGTLPRVVKLICTTPGGSGVAQFTVSSPAVGAQAAVLTTAVTMTNATPFTLAESAQITPTIVTSFATNDTFIINLAPAGFYYTPVSTGFESCTIYLYLDGLLHKVTGCRGTFTVEGQAASFATYTFTFTGDYVAPVDQAMPSSPVYETTLPPQVELANIFAAGGENDVDFALCAQSFSINMANDVVARECINEANSLGGAIITGRKPVGGFNPETELEATHPFWANLSNGAQVVWGMRIGSVQGNVNVFFMPYTQYSDLKYTDRNGIRAYDVSLKFATNSGAQGAGNDEIRILFC